MLCIPYGCLKWISNVLVSPYIPHFIRFKAPDPVPREIEGKPFSNPPTDPLHPHIVQPRTKTGGHDSMSMHPQARSQRERPDPSGASRTGGAPLRRFAGTSLPNSKVGGNKMKPEHFPLVVIVKPKPNQFLTIRLLSQSQTVKPKLRQT